MQADAFFKENIAAIWGGIKDKHRENLTAFMKWSAYQMPPFIHELNY